MDARAQFEVVLADHLDGTADAARNRKLADLLRTRPDLQAEYLDQLQMHALLQWRGGRAAPVPIQAWEKVPLAASVPSMPSRRRLRRGMAAALFLTAACFACFFFLQTPQAEATPDVIERLIDLNVDLARLPTREERLRVFDQQATALAATLAKTPLSSADRELAETLLENGAWMTRNDDPMAEAERFSDIADKLLVHMDAATTAKDQKRMAKLAAACQQLTDAGIESNLKRAASAGPAEGENLKKLERMAIRQANRDLAIAAIIERSPDATPREIRRELKALKMKKK